MASMKMEKPVKETAKPSAAKSSASKAAPKKPAQPREPRKKVTLLAQLFLIAINCVTPISTVFRSLLYIIFERRS